MIHCIDGLIMDPEVSALLSLNPRLFRIRTNVVLVSWSVHHPLCGLRGVVWVYDGVFVNYYVPKFRYNVALTYNPKVIVQGIDLEGTCLKGTLQKNIGSFYIYIY